MVERGLFARCGIGRPAHHWYASLLEAAGRSDEAMAQIGRALEFDPLSLVVRVERAALCYFERDYGRAVDESRKALQLDSRFVLAYFNIGRACAMQGRHREAIAALKRAMSYPARAPRSRYSSAMHMRWRARKPAETRADPE